VLCGVVRGSEREKMMRLWRVVFLWCGIIGVSVSMKGKNKMINKRFCKKVFEMYLEDCGLDTSLRPFDTL
jgi:hypothetical protein